MKLFDYETHEDYGKEWFFQILTCRRFALLDLTVQWDDYGADGIIPEIALMISTGQLFGLSIRYKRFQLDLEMITARPRDLRWYKEHK